MPPTEVVYFKDEDGEAPAYVWLKDLRNHDKKAFAKLFAKIDLLAAQGYELRRPHGDFLRDGIHELRAKSGHVNLRLLYFFHDRTVAVLAAGCTKEDVVPDTEINAAIERKKQFARDPNKHTYTHRENNTNDRHHQRS